MKLGLEKYVFSSQILVKAAEDKCFRKWLSANRKELAER